MKRKTLNITQSIPSTASILSNLKVAAALESARLARKAGEENGLTWGERQGLKFLIDTARAIEAEERLLRKEDLISQLPEAERLELLKALQKELGEQILLPEPEKGKA